MSDILILYYSKNGSTKKLAELIARGVEMIDGMQARIRTVPNVSAICEKISDTIPDSGYPYVTHQDLKECVGLALGSPVRFGNMDSSLKYFFDSTSTEWILGTLAGKPATLFTSSASMHGGQEACIFSMMIPLLHHGMVIVGIPYTEKNLIHTTSGGTPYGVSHTAGPEDDAQISMEEKQLAIAQGKRLAEVALKLCQGPLK